MNWMIPTKVTGIVHQPGGEENKCRGWRIIAQLASLSAISLSEVPTIMQEKADSHNATMLPQNPYIIAVIISVKSSRGEGGTK